MMGDKESSASGSPVPTTQLPPLQPAPRIGISGDDAGMGAASGGVGVGVAEGIWSGGGGAFRGGGSDLVVGRKKRGRPRRHDYGGRVRLSHAARGGGVGSSPESDLGYRVGQGEPYGSSNWHLLAQSGWFTGSAAGGDFTPYVLSVQAGEDVAARIFSLFHKGPQEFCILSANGEISDVTLRHVGSGFFVTYEGCFEILALTGLFRVDDAKAGGTGSTTGGLSISLAGPDGHVIGGSVAGPLRAATPIQIVVGSFIPNGYKSERRNQHSPSLNPPSVPCEHDHLATMERAIPYEIPGSSPSIQADLQPLAAENLEKEVGDHNQGDGPNLNEVSPYAAQRTSLDDSWPYPDISISIDDD